ncbi:MAG: hypothetical protein AAF267_13980 [Deinococcota bacterium]
MSYEQLSSEPDVTDTDTSEMINWQVLEQRIPLDDLPSFHRQFLQGLHPEDNWQEVNLRQIQSKVQANLKQLTRAGRVQQQENVLLVPKSLIPDAFWQYLEEAE